MCAHFLHAVIEGCTAIGHFFRKDALFCRRMQFRCSSGKQSFRRRIGKRLHRSIRECHADFDRTVQNIGQFFLKTARALQADQIGTAGKRQKTEIPDRFRNIQIDQRITVGEHILRNGTQRFRQTNLLIIARLCKRERTNISQRIRQNQTTRPKTAGKCVHFSDLYTVRNDDVQNAFQSAESPCRNTAQTLWQINGTQGVFGFICACIDLHGEIRGKGDISFRNTKNMLLHRKRLRFLSRQNVIIRFNQF